MHFSAEGMNNTLRIWWLNYMNEAEYDLTKKFERKPHK